MKVIKYKSLPDLIAGWRSESTEDEIPEVATTACRPLPKTVYASVTSLEEEIDRKLHTAGIFPLEWFPSPDVRECLGHIRRILVETVRYRLIKSGEVSIQNTQQALNGRVEGSGSIAPDSSTQPASEGTSELHTQLNSMQALVANLKEQVSIIEALVAKMEEQVSIIEAAAAVDTAIREEEPSPVPTKRRKTTHSQASLINQANVTAKSSSTTT